MNLIAERVRARAGGFQTLQSAMHENRYQGGPVKALGRAARTGTYATLAAWIAKEAIGATTGKYFGE